MVVGSLLISVEEIVGNPLGGLSWMAEWFALRVQISPIVLIPDIAMKFLISSSLSAAKGRDSKDVSKTDCSLL